MNVNITNTVNLIADYREKADLAARMGLICNPYKDIADSLSVRLFQLSLVNFTHRTVSIDGCVTEGDCEICCEMEDIILAPFKDQKTIDTLPVCYSVIDKTKRSIEEETITPPEVCITPNVTIEEID